MLPPGAWEVSEVESLDAEVVAVLPVPRDPVELEHPAGVHVRQPRAGLTERRQRRRAVAVGAVSAQDVRVVEEVEALKAH